MRVLSLLLSVCNLVSTYILLLLGFFFEHLQLCLLPLRMDHERCLPSTTGQGFLRVEGFFFRFARIGLHVSERRL